VRVSGATERIAGFKRRQRQRYSAGEESVDGYSLSLRCAGNIERREYAL